MFKAPKINDSVRSHGGNRPQWDTKAFIVNPSHGLFITKGDEHPKRKNTQFSKST